MKLLPELRKEITKPEIGEYVLLTRYEGRDSNDPWVVGYLDCYGFDRRGPYYKVQGHGYFRHAWRISDRQGMKVISQFGIDSVTE